MDFNPAETARVLKAREKERVIVAPSGLSYKVRALTAEEILVIRGGIPDLASMALTDEEAARSAGKQSARDLAIVKAVVRAGLVEPALGDGEGQIQLDDIFFSDLMECSGAIWEMSGVTRKAAAAIRPLSDSGAAA